MLDPKLTERGYAQAQSVRGHELFGGAELVVVSPLSRAVQTAAEAFGEASPSAPGRFLLSPLHTERYSGPCDQGRPKSELVADFSFLSNWEGYDELPENWTPSTEDAKLWKRTRLPDFKRWLLERPEKHIVVVGHGCFFQGVIGKHLHNCEVYEVTPEQLGGNSDRSC